MDIVRIGRAHVGSLAHSAVGSSAFGTYARFRCSLLGNSTFVRGSMILGPRGFGVSKFGGGWNMFWPRAETRAQHQSPIHVQYCGGGYAGGSAGC